MEVDFPGLGQLRFDPNAREELELMVREIVRDGAYLRDPIVLSPGAVIFDVGANVGVFSRWVQKRLAGDCRIFAFEPIPSTFAWLSKNLEGQAHLFPFALGSSESTASFTVFAGLPGNASMVEEEKRAELKAFREQSLAAVHSFLRPLAEARFDEILRSKTVTCPVRTLSAVVDEEAVMKIDLLKIDVEWAELAVLEGINSQTWSKIQQVALETHGAARADLIVRKLEDLGFDAGAHQPSWATDLSLENFEVLAARRIR